MYLLANLISSDKPFISWLTVFVLTNYAHVRNLWSEILKSGKSQKTRCFISCVESSVIHVIVSHQSLTFLPCSGDQDSKFVSNPPLHTSANAVLSFFYKCWCCSFVFFFTYVFHLKFYSAINIMEFWCHFFFFVNSTFI